MKKIGIVTLNHGYNYGNKLQNYAMVEVYKKNGFIVETISFEPVKQENKLKLEFKKIKDSLFNRNKLYRANKFKEFNKKYLNMTSKIYNNNNYMDINEHEYELFSVGSDQVWNSYFWDFSTFYLLDFVKDNNKKFAYAASFGVEDINEMYSDKFSENLKKFKDITVREQSATKLVKKIAGKDAKLVLDPTMLLEKNEWLQFIKSGEYNEDKEYVFIYFLGKKDENAVKMIEELKQKYKIIDLNDIHNKYYKSNPNEFLYLLKNSKIVLTDSFHASVFSIIFEKPFVVFDRNSVTKKMNSRIETLLNELELKHHKYSSNMNESVIFDNKYDNANRILRSKRNECLSYVNKFLGDYND